LLLVLACAAAGAAQSRGSAAVSEDDVSTAVEKLKSDPQLALTHEVRRLRWIGDEEDTQETPGWVRWISDLARWLAEASRVFVWLLIASLVAVFGLYVIRFVRSFEKRARGARPATPTHVHNLDIRPESLPDDIGAVAWALWEGGEHREAMALLYRGLLSRLVHVHAVPIRHSSTEGDSLALAEQHLPPERHAYIGRLIRTWQRAVYGGRDPQGAEMRLLCEQFAAALLPGIAARETSV
jgi:hypothetical protein